jgi:hypothetical protein
MCIVFHFLFQFVRSFAGHAVTLPPDGNNATGRDIGHLAENLAAQSMTDLAQRGSLGVREPKSVVGSAAHPCELLKLGFEVAQSSVAKYMVKRCGPPSQGWRTFLRNHAPDIAAMDLFVVPYTTNTSECKFATGTAVRF